MNYFNTGMNYLTTKMQELTKENSNSEKIHKTNKISKTKESYVNMGAHLGVGKNPNYLPDVNKIPQNYPVDNIKQLKETSLYEYPDPNQATDKYFDQNLYEERSRQKLPVGRNPQEIYSLSDNWMNNDQFKFENMRPFVGGKVTGYTYDTEIAETVLDNYVGNGSQVIKKIEQAPLFRPQENVQWPLGMPTQTDFFQSRVNPSWKDNSVKLFESERVAPGLDLGYTTQGMGGYNSGMLARDKWMDKTIDELRVATNPKIEYDLIGHEGPANSFIKNRGIIGLNEKNRPDTFYIQGQDRWFTTTGAAQGERLRPVEELGIIKRNDGTTYYTGPPTMSEGPRASRAPTLYEGSKRQTLDPIIPTGSSAAGRGVQNDNMDSRMNNYIRGTTNRSTTIQPPSFNSGFSSAIGAVLAPITDVLRPTKREELSNCGKVVYLGSAKSCIPKDPIYNPADTAPTTIRETTQTNLPFYVNNQQNGIYMDYQTPGKITQRDTTSEGYMGPVGGQCNAWGNMIENPNTYQTTNMIDKTTTLYNRPALGSLGLFTGNMGAVNLRSDTNCGDPYVGAANSIIKLPGSTQTFGHMSSRYHDDIPGSAARNHDFVVQEFLNNPFTHSLTQSV